MLTDEQLDQLKKLKTKLEQERDLISGNWEDIIRFCLPELDKKNQRRYSNKAVYLTNISCDALQGWAFGESIDWLKMELEQQQYKEDEEIKDYSEATKWLESATDIILKLARVSGFYTEGNTFTRIGMNLSTAIMLIDWNETKNQYIIDVLDPRDCCLKADKSHEHSALFYDFVLTTDEAKAQFEDECPSEIEKEEEVSKEWKFTKAILKASVLDLQVSGTGDWIEIIYCTSTEDTEVVSERRMITPHFVVWPFKNSPISKAWGCNSPGEVGLPDVYALNAIEKSLPKGIQRKFDPPKKATKGLLINDGPGEITYLEGAKDYQYVPVPSSTDDVIAIIDRKENNLRELYMVDFFLILQQTINRDRTATESELLTDEKSQIMSSFSSRLMSCFLEPAVEIMFSLAVENSMLPPAPESIHERNILIDYISPLTIAQKQAMIVRPSLKYLSTMMELSQFEPSLRFKFKFFEFAESYASELKIRKSFIRTNEEAQELAQQEAQAIAQQQNFENEMKANQVAASAYSATLKKPEDGSLANQYASNTGGTINK